MGLLDQLRDAISTGGVEIIDLTAPLSSSTPILQLPDPFANTIPFQLEEISRYDEKGPAWYWNNIHTGEHTGTHLDVPVHWVSGKDGHDVSQVPIKTLVAPAVVIDVSSAVAGNDDFLLEIDDVKRWESAHGALPDGGWLLVRSGWSARPDVLNEARNPGMSAECARWLAEETPLTGVGVETVGTDAGAAHSFDPPFPCHNYMMGAGKHGLTLLRNLETLPATGTMLVVSPLPIVGGSGSPARVFAMVER
ncbi:cyclase family protein [Kibdelosporangium philippinense]|uniref:Cyclase family protein n=1 Tax=Kibdelosporangium philippinense TaxID=211113 RepID=A0ABS8ZWS0_9PSEU|nr:cyclase family protein [Kibdelosporangium philippinense]MCE7012141.1 cyclase family protein [Kibdelosporangium philippinense]